MLAFSSSSFKIDQSKRKCLIEHSWDSFPNGEEGYEELEAVVAYRIGLKTWANWVDSNINPNKTRVFFTTMSPTHMRSLSQSTKENQDFVAFNIFITLNVGM